MTNQSTTTEAALDQLCPWCARPPEIHDKNNLGIRYLGCPTKGCVGRDMHFIIDHRWNSRIPAPSVAPEVDEDLRNAFVQAAIEAHVGFQHLEPWADCDMAICNERKRLIQQPSTEADNADNAERDQAFREFWREQERERPFDYQHPERYATFTKRYAPPAPASTVAPVEQSEHAETLVKRWMSTLQDESHVTDGDAEDLVFRIIAYRPTPALRDEAVPCVNCSHSDPHNGPAGTVDDACTHEGCNCGYYQPATTPPSTLAKAAAEEIDKLLVPLREYAKTPGISEIAAIIERCLSGGGEQSE